MKRFLFFFLALLAMLLAGMAEQRRLFLGRNPALKPAAGGGAACPSGLIASWYADDSRDDAQGTNDLVEPTAAVHYTNGIINSGFWFKTGHFGIAEAIDGPDISFGSGVSKTFSFWIWPAQTNNAYVSMVAKQTSGGGAEEYVSYLGPDTKLSWTFYQIDGGSTPIISAHPIQVSNWTHIVVAYDAGDGSLDMWQNGTNSTTTATVNGTNTTSSLYFGYGPVSSIMWQGIVDEIQVYNAALVHNDATNLYNFGLAKRCP